MKKILLIVLLPLFLWFCGAKVISHTISIAIDVIIGYYVLFLLCSRIMYSKGFEKLEEMLKEYKIEGIPRVILTSFQDFGDFFNIERFFRVLTNYFYINKTGSGNNENVTKVGKKHIKDNITDDINIVSSALINVLESSEKICKGISCKRLVEENFNDKWSYFCHSRYIEKILCEINKKCAINNLSALGVLVVYSDEKIYEGYFNNTDWKIVDGITKNTTITSEKIQLTINQMKMNIEKYKKVLL